MKGVIMAAARSPRLLPFTKNTPVSLLEVAGEAILGRQLDAFNAAGTTDIVVITGFCADQIERFCRGRATCVFNPFYDTCNVALNLWMVRRHLESEFVLQYGDTLFVSELIRELTGTDGEIQLVVDRAGVDKEAEKVVLEENRVTAIGKDVRDPFGEFVGMAKFSSAAIPALTDTLALVARGDLDTSFPRLVTQLIEKGHPVTVHTTRWPWIDIDFPSDLERASSTWPPEPPAAYSS